MKRRPRTNPASEKLGVAPPARDPEVVAFIAAVLRQMDHAANLVVAFFRSVGLLGPTETSLAGLPGEFLLELAAKAPETQAKMNAKAVKSVLSMMVVSWCGS